MSGRKLYFVVNGLNYQKNLAAQLLIGWMQRLVRLNLLAADFLALNHTVNIAIHIPPTIVYRRRYQNLITT